MRELMGPSLLRCEWNNNTTTLESYEDVDTVDCQLLHSTTAVFETGIAYSTLLVLWKDG